MSSGPHGPDLSNWVDNALWLVGGGSAGFALREAMKLLFKRADRADDDEIAFRREQRETIERQTKRIDELTTRLDQQRDVIGQMTIAYARIESENVMLRQRFHRWVNWYSEDPANARPPSWVFDVVAGPTAGLSGEPRRSIVAQEPPTSAPPTPGTGC